MIEFILGFGSALVVVGIAYTAYKLEQMDESSLTVLVVVLGVLVTASVANPKTIANSVDADDEETQTVSITAESTETEDPIEVFQDKYATGEISHWEFEVAIEQVLEQEMGVTEETQLMDVDQDSQVMFHA